MTPRELLDLLYDLYQETQALTLQRQATARAVRSYDVNNAYQQIIGRQETHREWIAGAIADMGGSPPPVIEEPPVPPRVSLDTLPDLLETELQRQDAFLTRWQERAASIGHARHRKMIQLLLGEMLEHRRVFEQALAGKRDLLGRHSDRRAARGKVLPGRLQGNSP